MRADCGTIARKSRVMELRASSAMAPAISTPVGPPPTTTNVSSARRSASLFSISARSNAVRILARTRVASSIVLMPGASFSQVS